MHSLLHACKGTGLELYTKKNTNRPQLIGNLGFCAIEIFKKQIESIVLASNAAFQHMHRSFIFCFYCFVFVHLSFHASTRFVWVGRAIDFNTFIVNGRTISLNQEATIKSKRIICCYCHHGQGRNFCFFFSPHTRSLYDHFQLIEH